MNAKLEEELQIFMANVTWLRKQNGLSQKEMAEMLEISVGTLRKIEQGILPPNLMVDVIWRLMDHFHISPAELFDRRMGE